MESKTQNVKTQNWRAGGMAQVEECLSNKHEEAEFKV
jgi:hypothetical protein